MIEEEAYTAEIARLLREKGFCAANIQADEVQVRNNLISEHYDLVQADGTPWLHLAARCQKAIVGVK